MKRALVLFAVLGGCASTSPEPAFRDVAATVEKRSGHRIMWDQGGDADRAVDAAVQKLMNDELSIAGAVQIALLRNRELRATYEELSIAQADLVQAGLLKNPTFSASITTAERDNLDPNVIFGVTQDFLDLLMLPARKTIAREQLEAVKLRVGDAVLALASNVRTGYVSLQGALQIVAMRRLVADAAQASFELATRQHDAGNISDLAHANEQALYEQSRLDLTRADADARVAREKLAVLMGVWGKEASFRVSERLPDVPRDETSLDKLESLAIAQRLDLAALRKQSEALAYAVNLAKTTRWTGVVNVGADVARLHHDGSAGEWVIGPNIAIEVPLFDRREAAIARLEAFHRQALHRLEAHAVEVRSEVRVARDRLVVARRIVEHYRAVLIPLRERIVALSQQEYDAMLLGVYQLLLAKQSEVSAYREYIEAVRDYWIARSDLERAVGGRIGAAPDAANPTKQPVGAPSASPSAMPPMDHSKMHH